MLRIVDIRLQEIEGRLAERRIKLDLDAESKNYIISVGYSSAYGARPLNRAIQSDLLNPLSVMILSGRVRDNETVKVRFDGPHNQLHVIPNHEPTMKDEQWMDIDEDLDDIEIEEMD